MNRPALMVAGVFSVALAVRLLAVAVWLPLLKPAANPDYYRELAHNLQAGKGYVAVAPSGRQLPNLNRPPLYPVVLAGVMAVTGDRLGALLAANCLLAALTCVVTVAWAARWLPLGAAVAAGLVTALEPSTVLRCCLPMSEPLFTLLIIAGACALTWRREKMWAWAATGLCWGLAALTRAIAIWLWPVGLIIVLFTPGSWSQRGRCYGVFWACYATLIGLWFVRNHAVTGRWLFSTSSLVFRVDTWGGQIEALRTGESIDAAEWRARARIGELEFFAGREQFGRACANVDELLHERRQSSLWQLAQAFLLGAGRSLLGPGQRMLEAVLREPRPLARWWAAPYTGLLAVLVALAAWGAVRRWRELWLVLVLAGYFVVLSAAPVGNSRFRYPVVPLLAILACAAVVPVRRSVREENQPVRPAVAPDQESPNVQAQ